MRPRIRAWVAAATVAALLGTALALEPELRTFVLLRLAPARARDALLVRLVRPAAGADIVLLGTIHGAHLETPEYTLAHLEAVLRHLRPARLLVESRPEALAAGNLADGPIEMAYAHLSARALGIEVDGLDWFSPEKTGARRTDAARDDHMVANLLERLSPDGTTLVLIGYSHVAEFVARLEIRGFSERPVTADEKAALFDTSAVPPKFPRGLTEAVTRRITLDETRLLEADPPDVAERLRAGIAARRGFLTILQATGERSPDEPPEAPQPPATP